MLVGMVLSQNIYDVEHVISRSLMKAEQKYCTTRREMLVLALVWLIDQFSLFGWKFTVWMDHSAFQWLQSFKEPEGPVAWWIEKLTEYNFEVQHCPGKKYL